MAKRANNDKLRLWQDRLSRNESAYESEASRMDEREALYAGVNQLRAIVRGERKTQTPHVRNICAELIEAQTDSNIPQPKVTSAVLKLTMRKEPVCEIKSETMFFKVVRAAFAQRRKTLLIALSSGLSQFDKPALAAVIEDCGFAPTVRGETLDIPGFAAIANALTEL